MFANVSVSVGGRMEARRQAIRHRAAALEAAEAQRRFQEATLGQRGDQAGGPNMDRFVQQLTGRVHADPCLLSARSVAGVFLSHSRCTSRRTCGDPSSKSTVERVPEERSGVRDK